MRSRWAVSILGLVTEAHGSTVGYSRGCRCRPCRIAWTRYVSTRQKHAVGMVDASEARAHLRRLQVQGIGYRQVARLTEVGVTTVIDVRSGRRPRIRPGIAARLVACQAIRADCALVTAWWPRRHIDALLSEGFTARQFHQATGINVRNVRRAGRVYQRTAARIDAVYRSVVEDADGGGWSQSLRNLEVYAHG